MSGPGRGRKRRLARPGQWRLKDRTVHLRAGPLHRGGPPHAPRRRLPRVQRPAFARKQPGHSNGRWQREFGLLKQISHRARVEEPQAAPCPKRKMQRADCSAKTKQPNNKTPIFLDTEHRERGVAVTLGWPCPKELATVCRSSPHT